MLLKMNGTTGLNDIHIYWNLSICLKICFFEGLGEPPKRDCPQKN